jgi:hypothetical protein
MEGTYVSKTGKDACMASNLKALHIYFFSFYREILTKVKKTKKKNLTIRKFAEQKKKVQTLSSRKTHKF